MEQNKKPPFWVDSVCSVLDYGRVGEGGYSASAKF